MADAEKELTLVRQQPMMAVTLLLPHGFDKGEGWEPGMSYHIEQSERGRELVKDERPL